MECINKGLKTIPQGIDHGTQVLDMTGNSLIILSHEKFKVGSKGGREGRRQGLWDETNEDICQINTFDN